MQTGFFEQAALAAAANTTLYTVPDDRIATANINICNRGAVAASVRLAFAAADVPVDSEYIEYGYSIPANGVLERTGFLLPAGKKIVVWAETADVSVTVHGPERGV